MTSNARELRAIVTLAHRMVEEWRDGGAEDSAAAAALAALAQDYEGYIRDCPDDVDPQGLIVEMRDAAEELGRMADELSHRFAKAKWTVIGMHQGEPVHAHVECRATDAWDEACRVVLRDPDKVDWSTPEGTGATGICLAILPGWVMGDFCGHIVTCTKPSRSFYMTAAGQRLQWADEAWTDGEVTFAVDPTTKRPLDAEDQPIPGRFCEAPFGDAADLAASTQR